MMWKLSGAGGQWASMSGTRFDADTRTLAAVDGLDGRALPVTPVGPHRERAGATDPVWLYLAARSVIPGEQSFEGTPPELPIGHSVPDVDY